MSEHWIATLRGREIAVEMICPVCRYNAKVNTIRVIMCELCLGTYHTPMPFTELWGIAP